MLKFVYGSLLFWSEGERSVFAEKICQWFGNTSEIGDEAAEPLAESQELSEGANGCRIWEIRDRAQLVHGRSDSVIGYGVA